VKKKREIVRVGVVRHLNGILLIFGKFGYILLFSVKRSSWVLLW
jgi:hypothetical protein